MDNLPGNPHADEWSSESSGSWGTAQATMALAYEQRTANLIALAVAEREPFNPDYDMETIYKRLGLGN